MVKAADQFAPETKRQVYEILRTELENDRTSFLSHWRQLGDYVLPRRPRFTVTDNNRGERRNQNIIDSTATIAARTLRSGMMGGITSPARPWFKLSVSDPVLAESMNVKRWLSVVTDRMADVFLRSNLYNTLPIVYGDMGVFGTSALLVEEDFEDVIRTYAFPIGSYMIAVDERGKVVIFFREFQMTVRNLVSKFGKQADGAIDWTKFSEQVKKAWRTNQFQTKVDVCHVIQPNPDYDPNKFHSKYKKFVSCYYERGFMGGVPKPMAAGDEDVYLRESGYDYFPVLCPRWETNAEDSYATDCPGMTCLGDAKAIQTMMKRKAQWVEKTVNPPMTGPTALRASKASILPGDITYSDEREGQKGFRPSHEITQRIQDLIEDMKETRFTIKRAFFEDLFLMLTQSDRREITAKEIEVRHEEKLLALGPVLEGLNQDLLDPLIEITFQKMEAQGLIPPPPEELQGAKLKIEYTSVMAQAQKLVGISSIERLFGFVANYTAQTKDMGMIQKINVQQAVDVYSDRLGVDPSIIRSDEEVAQIVAEQQKAQKAAAALQAVQTGAGAAKDLSGAKMGDDNALTRLTQTSQAGQLAQKAA